MNVNSLLAYTTDDYTINDLIRIILSIKQYIWDILLSRKTVSMADLLSYVGKIINGGAMFGVLYFQHRERDKDLLNLWNSPATVRMSLLPTSIR